MRRRTSGGTTRWAAIRPSPWQDEGLAEWSMYAYYLARYGVLAAERLLADRWQVPIRYAIQTSTDRPIGLPVDSYGPSDYERTVYAKGALFSPRCATRSGEEAFRTLLRTYLERYRWRIATPADLIALANEVSGKDLSAMFSQWVEGKSAAIPLPCTSFCSPPPFSCSQ